MTPVPLLDLVALGVFVASWVGYGVALEGTPYGRSALNARMNRYREIWMRRMSARDVRIVDAQIMASLQSGTAFFASTSLIAIGGALTLLRSTEEAISLATAVHPALEISRGQWELKTIGLAVIFAYAFFKFAWAYRLFNYVAIMFGATPPAEDRDTPEAILHARRTAHLFQSAGRHFNRGQRGFFFALGYLGWFLGPIPFMVTTLGVVVVMWRRQFHSDSLRAILQDDG